MKLLALSNGHGEDVIAVRILEQLQLHPHTIQLSALPLVGEGYAYKQLDIPIIAPVKKMPSGGFIYMDRHQLWRDLQSGLIGLTLAQYQALRKWILAPSPEKKLILAVGDIVPLFFAWLSRIDYAFVSTAKSEYYLRDEQGWLPTTSPWDSIWGSVYFPWERWLMSHPRCQGVFPRDQLTTTILQQYSIPALALGNPMMDGINTITDAQIKLDIEAENQRKLIILLLPGSRMPESERNWHKIMQAVEGIRKNHQTQVVFLAAIAPSCPIAPFQEYLLNCNWQGESLETVNLPINDAQALAFCQENAILILSQDAYSECLLAADLAIAMAGTATEQFVGLGKPVFTIPGTGPQFTYRFAEAQTRLLGTSVTLVEKPEQVASKIQSLWKNPDRLQIIAENGNRRMGLPGAAARIADHLINCSV